LKVRLAQEPRRAARGKEAECNPKLEGTGKKHSREAQIKQCSENESAEGGLNSRRPLKSQRWGKVRDNFSAIDRSRALASISMQPLLVSRTPVREIRMPWNGYIGAPLNYNFSYVVHITGRGVLWQRATY
jgi:hypothetical protein